MYLLPTAVSFPFLHSVPSLSLFLLPLESLPHPDSVPGTRRSRSTYAATPGLERSRASSSAPPFTPRCSLENPTLFGSFDQSPPANYGLVMYRLLLGPPFFYVASRGPLLFFPFSSLFFCFFFVSLPSIRSNVRSCTRGSPWNSSATYECLLRFPSLSSLQCIATCRCSTLVRGFPPVRVPSLSLLVPTIALLSIRCTSAFSLHPPLRQLRGGAEQVVPPGFCLRLTSDHCSRVFVGHSCLSLLAFALSRGWNLVFYSVFRLLTSLIPSFLT